MPPEGSGLSRASPRRFDLRWSRALCGPRGPARRRRLSLREQMGALQVQKDLAVAEAVRSKTQVAILAKMNARLKAAAAAADAALKARAAAPDPYAFDPYATPRWQPFVDVTP